MKNSDKRFPNDAWESKKLGATQKYARKVSNKQEEAVDSALGLQPVSIRLQKTLIDALKQIAVDEGIGYQPYIRQLLTQHVKNKSGHTKPKKAPISKKTVSPKTYYTGKKMDYDKGMPNHGAI